MKRHEVVIVGGGYAGSLAAVRLARKGGRRVRVTLIDPRPGLAERVRSHQLASGQDVTLVTYDRLLGRGVRVVQGMATRIDPENRCVVADVAGASVEIAYDRLIYALGSRTALHAIEGLSQYAHSVADRESSLAASARLRELSSRARAGDDRLPRVVVCGGGATGIELASEVVDTYPGLKVTLVDAGRFGASLSKAGADRLRSWFSRRGVEILEETEVERITEGLVSFADGTELSVDMILWCGSMTVPDLARRSGIRTSSTGQVLVDSSLRSTSHPEILAVGDSALVPDVGSIHIRMGCVTAMPMGAHGADVVLAELDGRMAPSFSFGYLLRCFSLGRRDGLVQFVEIDDRPVEKVVSGWMAALVKELIVRATVWSIRLERLGVPYLWPRASSTMSVRRAAAQ